jgi:hypothetical protein
MRPFDLQLPASPASPALEGGAGVGRNAASSSAKNGGDGMPSSPIRPFLDPHADDAGAAHAATESLKRRLASPDRRKTLIFKFGGTTSGSTRSRGAFATPGG